MAAFRDTKTLLLFRELSNRQFEAKMISLYGLHPETAQVVAVLRNPFEYNRRKDASAKAVSSALASLVKYINHLNWTLQVNGPVSGNYSVIFAPNQSEPIVTHNLSSKKRRFRFYFGPEFFSSPGPTQRDLIVIEFFRLQFSYAETLIDLDVPAHRQDELREALVEGIVSTAKAAARDLPVLTDFLAIEDEYKPRDSLVQA